MKNSSVPSAPVMLLRHVVLFKFKDDTGLDKLKAIENAFCALPSKINAIHDFEWGTDVSVEGKAQGFSHCFMVTFRSEADRDAYLPTRRMRNFDRLCGPTWKRGL